MVQVQLAVLEAVAPHGLLVFAEAEVVVATQAVAQVKSILIHQIMPVAEVALIMQA